MSTWEDAYYESLKKQNTCPICGKKFVPAPEHAWRIGNQTESGDLKYRPILVCSYSCMRKWEKEKINGNLKMVPGTYIRRRKR